MSSPFYNLCYFIVIRLFSLLYNHVQQQISNAVKRLRLRLRLVVDQNINHIALLLTMILSPSPFFSVLFTELQEQHSYLNYPYMVILQGIYVALLWSEN